VIAALPAFAAGLTGKMGRAGHKAKREGATYRQRLKLALEQDVVSFNAMLRQRNVPNLVADIQ